MNQHYVPKFIIEGFVDEDSPGNRGVWVYHAAYRQWKKRPTKRTASLDDFYSLIEPSGEREDAIEDLLHEYETPVALLLERDIGVRRAISSVPHRDDVFITFCAFLIARNPATVDSARRVLVREAQELIDEITSSDEAFQKFRQEIKAGTGEDFPNVIEFQRLRTDFRVGATKAGALAFAIATSAFWRDRLPMMDVTFLFAPPESPGFITSDVPYVWIMKEGEDQLDQVIVPLSARITAIFDTSEQPAYGYADAPDSVVQSVNRAILTSADKIIISASQDVFAKTVLDRWATGDEEGRLDLIRSLIKGGPDA
ncbi:MAG: DUF4238 domain-containing protein [Thermoanaerobaculia bacterium]